MGGGRDAYPPHHPWIRSCSSLNCLNWLPHYAAAADLLSNGYFLRQENRRNGQLYHHYTSYQHEYSLQLAIVHCTIVIIPRRSSLFQRSTRQISELIFNQL